MPVPSWRSFLAWLAFVDGSEGQSQCLISSVRRADLMETVAAFISAVVCCRPLIFCSTIHN